MQHGVGLGWDDIMSTGLTQLYIIVYLSRNYNEMVTTRPDLVGQYRYGLVANL